MIWGFFTPFHILTLLLAAAALVGLHFLLRGKSRQTQMTALFLLSLSGITAVIYNLVRWGDPLWNLPLHLCSLNAMALPIAVLTRSRRLGNLLLVWCLGALAALILNYDVADESFFGERVAVYFYPHVFEFGIPLLLFSLKLVEKDWRCIGSTMAITMAVYTAVHGVNKLVIHFFPEKNVNYMFSMRPNNPLVELFYSIIPCEYWYMYLVLPIVFVYLCLIYSPEIIRAVKNRR